MSETSTRRTGTREAGTTPLPDRIWVLGPTGSGKTTLAARLAKHMGIEATHMDDIHWNPGWVESPKSVTRDRTIERAKAERWVIDGSYSFARDAVADRIQLYVWLDMPLRITFTRLVRRGISRSIKKTPCCNGNYETLFKTFLHKDSLLLWCLTHYKETRVKARASVEGKPHVHLRSPREVDAWFQRVTAGRS